MPCQNHQTTDENKYAHTNMSPTFFTAPEAVPDQLATGIFQGSPSKSLCVIQGHTAKIGSCLQYILTVQICVFQDLKCRSLRSRIILINVWLDTEAAPIVRAGIASSSYVGATHKGTATINFVYCTKIFLTQILMHDLANI